MFAWQGRVYWEDTDAGGVVYHSRYLNLFERARSDWLRRLGFSQADLRDVHRRLFAVRRVEIDFRQPARLDDELEVRIGLQSLGSASMTVNQEMRRSDGLLLATARVRVASLDAENFRPARTPAAVLEKLQAIQENQSEVP